YFTPGTLKAVRVALVKPGAYLKDLGRFLRKILPLEERTAVVFTRIFW
ncbi:MAG: hypothetical protein HC866_20375, partial [Leptolyngbyaceae cyanobacterium RU_5_1]|nr:hypothetical protein [Leptolyngbyaceae cyanobacterium RU_5_1]